VLTLRYAGLRYALQKLGHQFYSHTIFLHTVGDLLSARPAARFPCHTVRASAEDVKELFDQMHDESNASKYQLLVRKWYHERGLGTPYVQKTLDTNEVCCIRWMVTAHDIAKAGFGNRFPVLGEDEVMLENVYTLERFRNKSVQTSSKARDILSEMGFKKIKGFVAEDNIPELRFLKGRESRVFEKVEERHFLFRVSRKTLEQYDPPIPITVPNESK